jgi:hypothetical protein
LDECANSTDCGGAGWICHLHCVCLCKTPALCNL